MRAECQPPPLPKANSPRVEPRAIWVSRPRTALGEFHLELVGDAPEIGEEGRYYLPNFSSAYTETHLRKNG